MQKKIIKLCGLIISFFAIIIQTKATKFEGNMELGSWTPVYLAKIDSNGKGSYEQGRFILRKEDGAFLYCLQPFVSFDLSQVKNYDFAEENYAVLLNMSEETWERVNLLAYFGYGYGTHDEYKWYTITQVMIWKTVDPNANIYFTNGLNGPKNEKLYVSEMAELNKLVDDYLLKPDLQIPNLNLGEEVDILDNNHTLHNYTITQKNNVDAEISGDSLHITSTQAGSGSVVLERTINANLTPPVIYFKEGVQNVFRYGKSTPLKVTVYLNSDGGTVNIHKVDTSGNNLEGVTFGVYNSAKEEVCTITTDSSGLGSCSNLPLGTYTVKELSTIEGYVLNTQTYTFSLTSDNASATLEIANKKITGFIEIYKIDKENNNATTQGDAKLQGAVYGIYNSQGKKVDELITDAYGYAKSKELEYGIYSIKELQPSEGYLIDPHVYQANINTDGIVLKTTSPEQVLKFDFNMLKVESDGRSGIINAEADAVFNIFLKSTKTLVGTITTDSTGKAKITLPYGIYNVCQIKGSDTTSLSPCFEINISTENVDKIVNNGLVNARLKVIKVDQDNNEIPIANLRFKIKNLNTNTYVCQTVSYPYKETYCEFKTNAEGILITPFPLEAGDYALEEVDQYIEGYLWNPNPLNFSIKANTIYDYDPDLGAIIELRFTNTAVKGIIEIYKLGEILDINDGKYTYLLKPLPNIHIGLYDYQGNFIQEYITDNNGYIKIENLKLGKYILKELKTSSNYLLDNQEYLIELKYQDQYTSIVSTTFTLKNYLKKGTIEFTKTDLTTGNPLPNVLIEIYTENNELIYTGITDIEGKIILDDLALGKYYLLEKEPLTGYLLNSEKIYFEITENNEIVKANMSNEKIKSKIKLHKVDEEGTPLIGVKFALYDEDDNYLGTYETNEEGDITLELEYGIYYFIEEETLNNYVLNPDKQYFEVTQDGQIIELSVVNIKVPDTLLNLNYNLILGGIFLVLKKKHPNT